MAGHYYAIRGDAVDRRQATDSVIKTRLYVGSKKSSQLRFQRRSSTPPELESPE